MTDIASIDAAIAAASQNAGTARRFAGSRWRDLATRAFVSCWFTFQATMMVEVVAHALLSGEDLAGDALAMAKLASRFCLFFFFTFIAWLTLVRARPLAQAPGLMPRACALTGAYLLCFLPLMPERELSMSWALASTGLVTLGIVLSCLVMLRLGKSYSVMAEARALVVSGPYAYIRHPLYLAEQIALTGAFIHYASAWTALLYVVQATCQVQRMRNEEAVLQRSFPGYAAYMKQTARLIPGVW